MESQTEIESTSVTPRSVGVKYGLILGAVSIVYFLILVFTGQNAFEQKWNWIGMIPALVVLVLAIRNFKSGGDGFMTYGQGVGIAFWISVVSTALAGFFTLFYVYLIDTGVMDAFYEAQSEQMLARGMPEDQVEIAIEWTAKLFWFIYFFVGIFFGVLMGLVVSIFTQRKNPDALV
jgi:hypothetical protein